MTQTVLILNAYADGKPHSNDEINQSMKKYWATHPEKGGKDPHKVVRGIQQGLKKRKILVNVGRGIWKLDPNCELDIDEIVDTYR